MAVKRNRKIYVLKNRLVKKSIHIVLISSVLCFLIYVLFIEFPPAYEFRITSQNYECKALECNFLIKLEKLSPRTNQGILRVKAYTKESFNFNGYRNSRAKLLGTEAISFNIDDGSNSIVIENSVTTLLPANYMTFWVGSVSQQEGSGEN